jgi:tetratricopeptide (TPR) repeat protein
MKISRLLIACALVLANSSFCQCDYLAYGASKSKTSVPGPKIMLAQGLAAENRADFQQAVKHYLVALARSEKLLADASKKDRLDNLNAKCSALLALSRMNSRLGNYSSSKKYAALTLQAIDDLILRAGDDSALLLKAAALRSFGFTQMLTGEYSEADHCFQKSLAVLDGVLKSKAGCPEALNLQSSVLLSQGELCRDLGQYSEARRILEQCVTVANSAINADSHNSMCWLYKFEGLVDLINLSGILSKHSDSAPYLLSMSDDLNDSRFIAFDDLHSRECRLIKAMAEVIVTYYKSSDDQPAVLARQAMVLCNKALSKYPKSLYFLSTKALLEAKFAYVDKSLKLPQKAKYLDRSVIFGREFLRQAPEDVNFCAMQAQELAILHEYDNHLNNIKKAADELDQAKDLVGRLLKNAPDAPKTAVAVAAVEEQVASTCGVSQRSEKLKLCTYALSRLEHARQIAPQNRPVLTAIASIDLLKGQEELFSDNPSLGLDTLRAGVKICDSLIELAPNDSYNYVQKARLLVAIYDQQWQHSELGNSLDTLRTALDALDEGNRHGRRNEYLLRLRQELKQDYERQKNLLGTGVPPTVGLTTAAPGELPVGQKVLAIPVDGPIKIDPVFFK